jgi:hypothetical protein
MRKIVDIKPKIQTEKRYLPSFAFIFSSVSMFFVYISHQIFNVDLLKSFGFLYDDGFCNNYNLLTKPHCFGDLMLFVDSSISGNLDDLKFTYSPNIRLVYLVLEKLLFFTSGNFLLLMYFSLFILSLILGWNILKSENEKINIIEFILICFAFIPLLFAIERGNSVIFGICVMIYLIKSVMSDSKNKVLIATFLLICLKAQFVIVLIPIFILYGIRLSVRLILLLFISNLLSMLIIYRDVLDYIDKIQKGFKVLLVSQDSNAEWPLNMSFSHVLSRLYLNFGLHDLEIVKIIQNSILLILLVLLIFITFNFKELLSARVSLLLLWTITVFQLNPLLPLYNLVFLIPFLFIPITKNFVINVWSLVNFDVDKLIKILILFNGAAIPILLNPKIKIVKIEDSNIIFLDNAYIFNLSLVLIVIVVVYSLFKRNLGDSPSSKFSQ